MIPCQGPRASITTGWRRHEPNRPSTGIQIDPFQPLTTVDNIRQTNGVSRNTMSFALPESMRDYVSERVRSGEYGNTSEYLRELIRQDQQQQAARHFRQLIADGLESGDARPATDEMLNELRQSALTTDL